ncbi:MAG: MerR family transcriptional regulator [Pseudomonadales bacterium]|nr:MerR family transcriptional regulator [Pseudomonadales bacterium]
MKFPKDTLRLIAQYLPDDSARQQLSKPEDVEDREYTVDELARVAGTTVRNIRAYQDKGILPPPTLRGRKGIYHNQHLARLKLVSDLLDRGYTLNSIKDLLDGLEQGIGLAELVGIESAISSPWSREEPQTVSMIKLAEMFGDALTPAALQMAVELELMKPDGPNIRVSSMKTLEAGAQLTATGIPLEDLLDILRMMRGNVERVANELVKLVADHVLDPYGEENLPPKEELPKIADLVWRLRPLSEKAVSAEFARAMERAANRILADRLEAILDQMNSTDTDS